MADVSTLLNRIDAEFAAIGDKIKKAQSEQVQLYTERQKRLEEFGRVLDRIRDVCRPRLELLVKKFGDKVKVTPRVVPGTRETSFEFQSDLARIVVKFSASADRDIRNVILNYDLEIVPVLIQFDSHSQIAFPLDAIDEEAIGRWVDERIISFVHSYLSLHESNYYMKDFLVEDPVVGVQFPKFAAGATLEWQGQTYYFIGEETRRDFEKQKAAAVGAAAR